MTYEEAKVKLLALKDTAKRFQEEAHHRSEYLKETLGFETASNDPMFVAYKLSIEGIGREIAALKEYMKTFPQSDEDDCMRVHKRMWSGLSDPEKAVINLIRAEIGDERFKELCKIGYNMIKERNAGKKEDI